MSKKRRVPAGRSEAKRLPYDLENEALAMVLGSRIADPGKLAFRLRERFPDLDDVSTAGLAERCSIIERDCYSMVAAALAESQGSPQAAGRILAKYPWMSLRNLEALCAQGFLLAK
jgi:hypothetical protein